LTVDVELDTDASAAIVTGRHFSVTSSFRIDIGAGFK